MPYTILLHSNHFSERGESTQFISLATQLQENWGTRVIIAYPKENVTNSSRRIEEAEGLGLEMVSYTRPKWLRDLAVSETVDLSFVMSDGTPQSPYYCREDPQAFRLGSAIHVSHVVFRNFHPHGDYYLYVSDWLYRWAATNHRVNHWRGRKRGVTVSSLPHGLGLPPQRDRNFRRELGIPAESFTIARIGGFDSFNDDAAKQAIVRLVEKNRNLYFIAVNTERFCEHSRIRHVDFVDRNEIASFYSSFDLFLNGQRMGETFGFSIVEPMAFGKPVLAPHWRRNPTMNRGGLSHITGLRLAYKSRDDLERKAQSFVDGRKVHPAVLQRRVARHSAHRFATSIMSLTGDVSLSSARKSIRNSGFVSDSEL